MLLSSEILVVAGASIVATDGGRAVALDWPGVVGPAGVEEHGVDILGFPRNLRDLTSSTRGTRLEGCAEPQTPGPRFALRTGGSESTQGSEWSLERTQ